MHCVRHIAEFQFWEKFLLFWICIYRDIVQNTNLFYCIMYHQLSFALNSSELQKYSKFWDHRIFKLFGRGQKLDSTETKWKQHVNDQVHVFLSSHANNLYPILVLVLPVRRMCVISIIISFFFPIWRPPTLCICFGLYLYNGDHWYIVVHHHQCVSIYAELAFAKNDEYNWLATIIECFWMCRDYLQIFCSLCWAVAYRHTTSACVGKVVVLHRKKRKRNQSCHHISRWIELACIFIEFSRYKNDSFPSNIFFFNLQITISLCDCQYSCTVINYKHRNNNRNSCNWLMICWLVQYFGTVFVLKASRSKNQKFRPKLLQLITLNIHTENVWNLTLSPTIFEQDFNQYVYVYNFWSRYICDINKIVHSHSFIILFHFSFKELFWMKCVLYSIFNTKSKIYQRTNERKSCIVWKLAAAFAVHLIVAAIMTRSMKRSFQESIIMMWHILSYLIDDSKRRNP